MKLICEYARCTGCGLCAEICPCNAISIVYDEKGYLRPSIDQFCCIDCGKCKYECPQNGSSAITLERKETPVSYACMHKDKGKSMDSTSGGAFQAIAEYILNVKRGIVFGAHYNPQKRITEHMRITDIKDLPMIKGSKYIQSEIGSSYSDARNALDNGMWVLFSGCPCQVNALYAFLGKDYKWLVTCDVVCHGVGSTLFFQRYLSEIEEKTGNSVTNYKFRDKHRGWSNKSTWISFDNNREIVTPSGKDPYMVCYYRQAIYRDSCYTCKYARFPRCGDFTLGDYFGLPFKVFGKGGEDSGISLLLVNSEKAATLFTMLNSSLVFRGRPLEEAVQSNRNITAPSVKPPFYDALIPPVLPIGELAQTYCTRSRQQIVKAKLKEWLIKLQLIQR